jgi:GDP-L-fucose synthase
MSQVKSIVVAGGTGFVGSHVMKHLTDEKFLPKSCSRSSGTDIRNYDDIIKYLSEEKPDCVINCAAHVGGIAYNEIKPVEIFEDNLKIGMNLVKACSETGVKSFINCMPNCVYPGNKNEYREDEWWDGPVHDSVLTYAIPRKTVWGLCEAYKKAKMNPKSVHLIFPNMYGPGDHFDPVRSHAMGALITKVVKAKAENKHEVEIWGTGKPVREWLFVEDAAEAVVRTVQNLLKFEENEVMNIGVGRGISITDMAELIKDAVEWNGNYKYDLNRPDGAMVKILIADKMRKKLNWEPKMNIKEGIVNTVKYLKAQS